jgi:ubiquinone/menaquinone biosynthesis C-methylase UbiE
VGATGKVIGVDMTEDMIQKANSIKEKRNVTNVEFRLGEIENLPVEDNSVDCIVSNCVINLVPNKQKAFQEMYRFVYTIL